MFVDYHCYFDTYIIFYIKSYLDCPIAYKFYPILFIFVNIFEYYNYFIILNDGINEFDL